MEKPGSGDSTVNPLIINAPNLQSLRQRYASALLTLIFWIIWIHLWLPLITLFGWLFGIDTFYLHMVELEGYRSLLSVLTYYLLAIAIISTGLGGWALINYLRFRNRERRRSAPPVSADEVCETFGVDEAELAAGRASTLITVLFEDDGSIGSIRCDDFPGFETTPGIPGQSDPTDPGPG